MFLQDFDRYEICRLSHWTADKSRCTKLNNSLNYDKVKCLLNGCGEYFVVF